MSKTPIPPSCKQCNSPIHIPNYYYFGYIEYKKKFIDCSPDGSSRQMLEDCGIFCSDKCLVKYLDD